MRVQIFRNLSGQLFKRTTQTLFSKNLVRGKTNRTSKFLGIISIDYCTEHEFLNFLKCPRIDSKESIPPANVAWRGGTTTSFLLGS
jgi:hypothetical protein